MTPSMSVKTSDSTLEERQARSIALEKTYVHDVYDQIAPHLTDSRHRAWPHVKKFLLDLEPGSIVADIGCGNGKYVDINPVTFQLGVDRCNPLLQTARKTGYETLACDNQQLPFRDETFDAAISIAVIHHFGTSERRVRALQELARVLRIGGKVMITVWAKEQSHRKFDTQDVLVPWHKPSTSSSGDDHESSAERELVSTITSEDDLLVYTAHFPVQKFPQNNRHNAFDSQYKGQRACHPSSSEQPSPTETCYNFVLRAFNKLAVSTSPYSERNSSKPYFYSSCRQPWFSESVKSDVLLTSSIQQESHRDECLNFREPDGACIELHHLGESYVTKTLADEKEELAAKKKGEKTWSINDLFNIIPTMFRIKRPSDKGTKKDLHKRILTISDPREYFVKAASNKTLVCSRSTMSCVSRPDNVLRKNTAHKNQKVRDKLKESVTNKGFCTTISDISYSNIYHSKINNTIEELEGNRHPKGLISNCSSEFSQEKNVSLQYPNNLCIFNMVNGMYTREKLHTDSSFFPKPKSEELRSRDKNKCSQNTSSIKDTKIKSNPESRDLQHRNRNKCCQKNDDNIKNQNIIYSEMQALKGKEARVENRLSSYYSMPELRTLSHSELFWIADSHSANTDHSVSGCAKKDCCPGVIESLSYLDSDIECREEDKLISVLSKKDGCPSMLRNRPVGHSLSTDTTTNLTPTNEPSELPTLEAQDLSVEDLKFKSLPDSGSSGKCKSAKSGTNVESEEYIMPAMAREGNEIQGKSGMESEDSSLLTTTTKNSEIQSESNMESKDSSLSTATTKNNGVQSESSVESEESIISVIHRGTSEIEALEVKRDQAQSGSHSTRASPLTLLRGSGKSSDSSPSSSSSGLVYSRFVPDSNLSQNKITRSALTPNSCSLIKSEITPQEKALSKASSNVPSCGNIEEYNTSPKLLTDKCPASNRHFKQLFTFTENNILYFDNVKKTVKTVSDTIGDCFIQSMDVTFTYQTRENIISQKKNSLQPKPLHASGSLLPETLKTEDYNLCVASQQFNSFPGKSSEQTCYQQQNTDANNLKGMAEKNISSHEPKQFQDNLQGRYQMKLMGKDITECSITDVAKCRHDISDITNPSCSLDQYNDHDVKSLMELLEKSTFENDKIILSYIATLKRADHKHGEQDRRNSLQAPIQFDSRATPLQLSDKHKFIDSLVETRKNNIPNNHFCLFADGPQNNISENNGDESKETVEKLSEHIDTKSLLQCGRTFQQHHKQDELMEKSMAEGILKLGETEKLCKVPDKVIPDLVMFRKSDWTMPVKLSNVNIEYNKVGLMKWLEKYMDVTHATTQENLHPWYMKSSQKSRRLEDKVSQSSEITCNTTKTVADEDQNMEETKTAVTENKNTKRAETSTAKNHKKSVTAKYKRLETITSEGQRMIINGDKKQKKIITGKDSILLVQSEIDNQMKSSTDEVNDTTNQNAQSNRSENSSCFQRNNTVSISTNLSQSDKTELCNHTSLIPKQKKLGTLSQNTSLSESTSHESLQDDEKDSTMTYHRYYHVFCRGELDSLIESYVENLHIISSYYDHANWCIVAEKVQVWTI